MKSRSLMKKLSLYYPSSLREKWDRGGLMVSRLPVEIKKILLCLDFDDEIYDFAVKNKPDLIITHHPFLFGSKMRVLNGDPVKKDLYERLEKNNMPVCSYHTNFDNAFPCGMNDELAERLELENIRPLETASMARGGTLKAPMEVHDFAKYAKEKLDVSYCLLINEGKPVVSKVAIIGGGGSREYLNALDEGYDIYISGDCPHHTRRDIVLRHFNYLDMPHEIEKAFMSRMKKTLLEIDPSLEIITIDHERLPEVI